MTSAIRPFCSSSLTRALALVAVSALLTAGCGDDPGAGSEGGGEGTNDTSNNTGDTGISNDTGSSSGGEDAGSSSGGEDSSSSSGGGDASSSSGGEDVGVDAGQPDTGGGVLCPGGDYCECNANDECDSGYCIPDGAGKHCAQTCVDSCKKEGYVCVPTSGAGGDTVNLCVLEGGNICNPCLKNQECQSLAYPNAVCIDNGDAGAFCGQGCKTDDGCPVNYECKDVKDTDGKDTKQCVPKGGAVCACSDAAIKLKLTTKCFNKTGSAKCEGQRKCLADGEQGAPPGGGLSACISESQGEEKCDGKDNDCDGDTDEEACDDKNPCTADSCDAANAQCKHVNQDGPCDADGSKCTKDDVCSNGVCKAGEALQCDDKNPCTKDSCDPKDGCKNDVEEGAACNADDNPCTVNDSCGKDGTCEKGKKKSCTDENPCVVGQCLPTQGGKCDYQDQDGIACDDGNACTVKDKCDKATCKGDPNPCDDGESCTDSTCDKVKGCDYLNKQGPCDDKDPCTITDNCLNGKCNGTGAKDCNDDNACTKDSCSAGKGCKNDVLTNTPCDDGNGCTQNDFCKEGKCESGTNECKCTTDTDCAKQEDGNLCNGTLYCDKSTKLFQCKVKDSTIIKCDASKDGECAKTSCVPKDGKCVTETTNFNGKSCNDGSLCTKNDSCKDGKCASDPVVCDDKNPCTDDGCDPKSGCTKSPNTKDCNADDDACTVADKCNGGVCDKGAAKSCDDKNACTKDSCDAKTGQCKYENLTTNCDDNNPCTVGDKCGTKDSKWQCVPGVGPDCDDKNPCTKDTCDPKDKGCKNTIDETIKVPCYTADPKTKDVGLCKGGHRTCDKEGKASAECIGEVKPSAKEACEGKDDDCDGTTDEGCKPTGYTARFGAALVNGKGAKYSARVFVGGSNAAGTVKGTKQTADLGFYAWVHALLAPKK